LSGRGVGVVFAHQLTDQLICPKAAEERHQGHTAVILTANFADTALSATGERDCPEPAIRLRARDLICALMFDAINS
jgi:hypothetical protein